MSGYFDERVLAGISVLRRTFLEAALALCELRDTAWIREGLLTLVFSITPADRMAARTLDITQEWRRTTRRTVSMNTDSQRIDPFNQLNLAGDYTDYAE